jgi:proteasome lid subunit RPN8/RPN11
MVSPFARLWRSVRERLFGVQRIHEICVLGSLLDDVCEMARGSYPKEMLAFLAATKGIRRGRVVIDELQLQAYDASVDSASVPLHLLPTHTNIVGTVHSHPGRSARPSDADAHLFSQFGFVHAIAANPYTRASVSFYDKEGKRIGVRVLESPVRRGRT